MINTAYKLWTARQKLNAMRARLMRFAYGDQWADTATDENGRTVAEREVLMREGMRPLTNNLIRRLLKTVVGRYRDMAESGGWYTAAADRADHDELDCRLLEEFLISGQSIQRVADDNPMYGYRPTVENVSPAMFFVNDFRDPRGLDVEVAGMLHDMSPAEVVMRFGGTTSERRRSLESLMSRDMSPATVTADGPSFFHPAEGRVRVVEMWSREFVAAPTADTPGRRVEAALAALGQPRRRLSPGRLVWRCRWMTPDGVVLDSYLSPWAHGGHPFVFKFYPLVDGEVHPFVEDLVGQQQHINRLIVLIDRVMASSAKGVLLYPLNQLPPGLSLSDVAASWASPTGFIPITGTPGPLPQQISVSGGETQAHRLLEIELKLFQDVSGVSDVLAGTARPTANTGAELYRQQVTNATIALSDTLKTFRAAIAARDAIFNSLNP